MEFSIIGKTCVSQTHLVYCLLLTMGNLMNIIGRLKIGQINPPLFGLDFLLSVGVFGDMSGANQQSETYGC